MITEHPSQKLNKICFSSYEVLLFKAILTLVYFGLFRISELVYTEPMHTARPLQWDSCNKALVIQIRKSKTDLTGKAVKLNIYPTEKGSICCIQYVLLFMQAHPKHEG